MTVNHVPGKNVAPLMLYALSTCIWCRKTRTLLSELGVEYSYVDVDLLEGEEKERAVAEVEKWNPARSFPTLVINQERSIIGFREQEIREALHAS